MNKKNENTTQNATMIDEAVPVSTANSENPVTTVPGSDTVLTQLREENEQLKAAIRNVEAHRQITGELERVGARSPELLYEAVKGDLQFSADGAVSNAAAIVGRLRKDFPEQFKVDKLPPSIDAGAGREEIPSLSKEALAKMKAEDIAKLDWDEVKRVLGNPA